MHCVNGEIKLYSLIQHIFQLFCLSLLLQNTAAVALLLFYMALFYIHDYYTDYSTAHLLQCANLGYINSIIIIIIIALRGTGTLFTGDIGKYCCVVL